MSKILHVLGDAGGYRNAAARRQYGNGTAFVEYEHADA